MNIEYRGLRNASENQLDRLNWPTKTTTPSMQISDHIYDSVDDPNLMAYARLH